MNKRNAIISILTGFIITQVCMYKIGNIKGYSEGYLKGGEVGMGLALDTVYKIIEKQVNNDSTVTHFTIAHPDTVSYFLSAKIIQQH